MSIHNDPSFSQSAKIEANTTRSSLFAGKATQKGKEYRLKFGDENAPLTIRAKSLSGLNGIYSMWRNLNILGRWTKVEIGDGKGGSQRVLVNINSLVKRGALTGEQKNSILGNTDEKSRGEALLAVLNNQFAIRNELGDMMEVLSEGQTLSSRAVSDLSEGIKAATEETARSLDVKTCDGQTLTVAISKKTNQVAVAIIGETKDGGLKQVGEGGFGKVIEARATTPTVFKGIKADSSNPRKVAMTQLSFDNGQEKISYLNRNGPQPGIPPKVKVVKPLYGGTETEGMLVPKFQSDGTPLTELAGQWNRAGFSGCMNHHAAAQVTSGLNFIHSSGLVHGDIKDQNFLVKLNSSRQFEVVFWDLDTAVRREDLDDKKLRELALTSTPSMFSEADGNRFSRLIKTGRFDEAMVLRREMDVTATAVSLLKMFYLGKDFHYKMVDGKPIRLKLSDHPEQLNLGLRKPYTSDVKALLQCLHSDPSKRPTAAELHEALLQGQNEVAKLNEELRSSCLEKLSKLDHSDQRMIDNLKKIVNDSFPANGKCLVTSSDLKDIMEEACVEEVALFTDAQVDEIVETIIPAIFSDLRKQ